MNIKNKLKSKIWNTIIKKEVQKRAHRIELTIPKVELQQKHIANCKLLLNREELLTLLPANAVCAELGVDEGVFSEKILKLAKPHKLYLVDAWPTKRYSDDKASSVMDKFKEEIDNGKIEIKRGYSTELSKEFNDNYFDWIYIDTAHTYDMTYSELKHYSSKMKKNGIIAGHDFVRRNLSGTMRNGVKEAVYKFCLEENWELIYITGENNGNPSFAIRKI